MNHVIFRPASGISAIALASLLAACSVGPEYVEPQIALPARYAQIAPTPRPSADYSRWWTSFRDPVLDQLIAAGLSDSVTIALAKARVKEAEALARAAGVTVSGTGGLAAQTDGTNTSSQVSLALVPDLFGQRQKQGEAAASRYDAERFNAQNARLTLLSSITLAYIDLRYYQKIAEQLQQDLTARRQTLRAVQDLVSAQAASNLDLLTPQALVAETEARIPLATANIAATQYRLATLLGQPAGTLGIDLRYRGSQPRPKGAVSAGVPADLLRLRPDVRQAERLYAAAVYDIGAAEAARYPTLTLSGLLTGVISGVVTTGSIATVGLTLPLFNQPALAATADASRARADQAYLNWRSAVLMADEQVETALVQIAAARRATASSAKVVDVYTKFLSLTINQFQSGGDVTLLDILDRERAIAAARTAEADNARALASYTVQLFTALGLGATEPEVTAPKS